MRIGNMLTWYSLLEQAPEISPHVINHPVKNTARPTRTKTAQCVKWHALNCMTDIVPTQSMFSFFALLLHSDFLWDPPPLLPIRIVGTPPGNKVVWAWRSWPSPPSCVEVKTARSLHCTLSLSLCLPSWYDNFAQGVSLPVLAQNDFSNAPICLIHRWSDSVPTDRDV